MRIAKEIVDFANLSGKYLEWLVGNFRAEGAGSVWGKEQVSPVLLTPTTALSLSHVFLDESL